MTIPCTVWLFRDWRIRGGPISAEWVPVFHTRTYWGAKRIVKRIAKVTGEEHLKIKEVWNPIKPNQYDEVEMDVLHILKPDGSCVISVNGQGHLPCSEHGTGRKIEEEKPPEVAHKPDSQNEPPPWVEPVNVEEFLSNPAFDALRDYCQKTWPDQVEARMLMAIRHWARLEDNKPAEQAHKSDLHKVKDREICMREHNVDQEWGVEPGHQFVHADGRQCRMNEGATDWEILEHEEDEEEFAEHGKMGDEDG